MESYYQGAEGASDALAGFLKTKIHFTYLLYVCIYKILIFIIQIVELTVLGGEGGEQNFNQTSPQINR